MIRVKDGVQPQLIRIVAEVANISEELDLPLTITSGIDGQHGEDSLHYALRAVDIRINDLKPNEVKAVVADLQKFLGTSYDVVLEADHIHVEFDPK